MNKRLQGLVAGTILGAVVSSGVTMAANFSTLQNVVMQGIKIVVDGKKLDPKDAKGNRVEPMLYNGTTYLPVRAVAEALGKEVYWDGPSYTVYLGKMNGKLEYPTKRFDNEGNIGALVMGGWHEDTNIKDNLGNSYSNVMYQSAGGKEYLYETICNMKYSRFKGTLFVPEGENPNSRRLVIEADGKQIYTSPEMTKISGPIEFDVDITGCYDLKIYFTGSKYGELYVGDAGFYQ